MGSCEADNLKMFADQLQETEEMVNRNTLLIEENHMKEMRSLIQTFWKFDFGKKHLLELREKPDVYRDIGSKMIESVIRRNAAVRDNYNKLIDDLASSFRKQLKAP